MVGLPTELAIVVAVKEEKGKIYVKLLKTKLAGSKNVDIEHLPWIQLESALSQLGISTSGGAPDLGQIARVMDVSGQIGTELLNIVSFLNYTVSASTEIKGLPNSQQILGIVDELKKITRDVNLPPNLQETINEAGAKVVEAIEKGQHYLAALNGLNVTGAQAQLAGVVIPQLKNMTTALTPFAGIITGNITSLLPGTNFDLGNLLNILPDELKKELFKNMPKDVQTTLNSYLALTQDYQVGNFGGAISGMRVNLEVFLPNVVNMLKDVTSSDELITKLQDIMSDTTLFGLDQLQALTSLIPTSFGNLSLNIGADGSITIDTGGLTDLLNSFTSQLSGVLSSSGSILDTISNFQDMIQRMKEEVGNQVKTTVTSSTSTAAYRAAVSKGSGGYQA